ncbi:hypothetical protein JCM9533A_12760 [Catenuloplanes niger JCM 9533]
MWWLAGQVRVLVVWWLPGQVRVLVVWWLAGQVRVWWLPGQVRVPVVRWLPGQVKVSVVRRACRQVRAPAVWHPRGRAEMPVAPQGHGHAPAMLHGARRQRPPQPRHKNNLAPGAADQYARGASPNRAAADVSDEIHPPQQNNSEIWSDPASQPIPPR